MFRNYEKEPYPRIENWERDTQDKRAQKFIKSNIREKELIDVFTLPTNFESFGIQEQSSASSLLDFRRGLFADIFDKRPLVERFLTHFALSWQRIQTEGIAFPIMVGQQ